MLAGWVGGAFAVCVEGIKFLTSTPRYFLPLFIRIEDFSPPALEVNQFVYHR